MSYSPPAYTDAGGSVSAGYSPPAYTDAGGDLFPPPPVVPAPTGLPRTSIALMVTVVQLTLRGVTHYFSDIQYGDPDPSTGIGRLWHQCRVVGDIAYSRGGHCVLWGPGGRSGGLGNIELLNGDRALDLLITGPQHDGWVQVFRVREDQPMSQAIAIAAAVVTRIEGRGEVTARVICGDIRTRLSAPLQARMYSAEDEVDEVMVGRPWPTAIGQPLSCPITIVNGVDYEYDAGDAAGVEILRVLDSGVEIDLDDVDEGDPGSAGDEGDGYRIADPPRHGIELLQMPVGRVVADLDATAAASVEIIGAAEGDFDTDIDDWDDSTVTTGGGTASVSWDSGVALLEADKSAVGGGIAAEARLVFPEVLEAGQRYEYSLDYDVELTEGAGLQAQFVPESGEVSEFVSFGYVLATGTGTLAGSFTAPASGKLRIRAAAISGTEISAEIDGVRLSRVAAGGNIADVLELLYARAGIGVDKIDAASLAALEAERPWPCSYWTDNAVSVDSVADQVLDSIFGWDYLTPTGSIGVGYLRPPEDEDESVLTITESILDGDIECDADLAPGLSTTISARRNWYRYGASELADDVSDAERVALTADYRVRVTCAESVGVDLGRRAGAAVSSRSEVGMATLLDDPEHAQALADSLPALYPDDVPRKFWRVPVLLNDTGVAALIPGAKITLKVDAYGCSAGRPLRFIDVTARVGDDACVLLCWGAGDMDP